MKNKQDKNTKENILAVDVRLALLLGGAYPHFFDKLNKK